MGSAGLRALVVLSDASCVGRESLHACCEFAGLDALLVKNPVHHVNKWAWDPEPDKSPFQGTGVQTIKRLCPIKC